MGARQSTGSTRRARPSAESAHLRSPAGASRFGRGAHGHPDHRSIPVTSPEQSPSRNDIKRWRQYLADERGEAATYRDLARRRTGEEREILLGLAEAEGRHEAHWLELLGNDVGRPLR